MNDKALNIKIPEELYNSLKEAANNQNISLASLVRMICSEYVERRKNPMKGMPEAVQKVFGYIDDTGIAIEKHKK